MARSVNWKFRVKVRKIHAMSERFSASSLRFISAAVVENNEVASSYQMTFSLDPFTRGTYKACTNNAAEARPVLS